MRLFVVAFLAPAILLGQSAAASADTKTLTTARAAHSLSAEEAARAYPVRIRGIAAYYERTPYFPYGEVFLLDSTGGVYVTLRAFPSAPVHPGTQVEVEGVSGAGGYASQVDRAEARVIGQSNLPAKAPLVTMRRLLTGVEDCRWVAIEGVVHSVWQLGNRERIAVEVSDGLIVAITVREAGVDYDRLIDAKVRIAGISSPLFNHNRQLTGTFLFLPSSREITVLEASLRDAFALPAQPIGSILSFTGKDPSLHRVHIHGRVILQWPGSTLCLTEAGHGICAETAQKTPVHVGDDVDVVGFPVVRDLAPALTDAQFRPAGGGRPLDSPQRITAEEALRGNYDSQVVEIEGQVIGSDRSENNPTIFLSAGKFVFPVFYPENSPIGQFESLQKGSVLRVTGICSMHGISELAIERDGVAVPSSFRILLRTSQDVKILKLPSWWTPDHALVVCGTVAAGILVAFFWIVMLRHRVEQQTRVIRDSEERLRRMAQHDTLTGLPNRALLYDRMQLALARAARAETRLGVLMADLDGFKEINDTLGHGVGDTVLCEVATRLSCTVRNSDTVARIGGDEFIVLLPDLKASDDLERIAAKIVAILSTPIEVGTRLVPISSSVGACTYPDGGTDIDALLQSADVAMYNAKSRGKNGYSVFQQKKAATAKMNQEKPPLARMIPSDARG